MPYKSSIYKLLTLLLVSNMATIAIPSNAQEKACVMTDARKKVCGTLIKDTNRDEARLNAPARSSSSVVLNYKYYTKGEFALNVQLIKCTRKLGNVNCKLSITKIQGDEDAKAIYFIAALQGNSALATDSKDDDYKAQEITIGNTATPSAVPLDVGNNQPITAIISFKIPQGVNMLKKLAFPVLNLPRGETRIASFSNVSISR